MSNYNEIYLPFHVTDALNLETISKYQALKELRCDSNNDSWVYVVEWFCHESNIYGLGADVHGNAVRLHTNVSPGLFVLSASVNLLSNIAQIKGHSVIDYGIVMDSNIFTVYDALFNESCYKHGRLVKIKTATMQEANFLHKELRRDIYSREYAGVSHYWSLNQLILLELFVLTKKVCKTIFAWFDSNLNQNLCKLDLSLPRITFDIETSSIESFRVPTGEDVHDILFTVSIYHSHSNTMYSLAHIPINDHPENIFKKMRQIDTYSDIIGNNVKRILQVYNNEKDLLINTLNLLNIPSKLHILNGFNSIAYDIKFLMLRCKFYNLPVFKNFYWNHGFAFGVNQIHIDSLKVSKLVYNLKEYNLNAVAKHLFNEKKEDVDAVKLRITYYAMQQNQRLYSINESTQWPPLCHAIEYNDQDVLLTDKIFCDSINLSIEYANTCGVSIIECLDKCSRNQFKILNESFTIGLTLNSFFTSFKSLETSAYMKYINDNGELDVQEVSFDMSKALIFEGSKKKKKYPGGFNFCYKEDYCPNVEVYDYRVAYVLLMERANISDETCVICPADYLYKIYPFIPNSHHFKTYDYDPHTGPNKSVNKVLAYKYIYEHLYCGGEFDFTQDELQKRQNAPVIIIIQKSLHHGVLSKIVEHLNQQRESYKSYKKLCEKTQDLIMQQMSKIRVKLAKKKMKKKRKNSDSDEESDENEEDSEADDENEDENDQYTNMADHLLHKSKFLEIHKNGNVKIKKSIELTENPLQELTNLVSICDQLNRTYEDLYRLRKITISSFYGILGKMSINLAAAVTALVRTYLISTASLLTKHGCKILYCDTDSFFLANEKNALVSNLANNSFPLMDLVYKDTKNFIFITLKKYFTVDQDGFHYTQNKNGPSLWKDAIEFFFNQKHIKTTNDLIKVFDEFFYLNYRNSKNWQKYIMKIPIKKRYEKHCPAEQFKNYITNKYPDLLGQRKYSVYVYKTDIFTDIVYRPEHELNESKFADINFFKFYTNIYKTIYNIVKNTLRINNCSHKIGLSLNLFFIYCSRSFINTYNEHFKVNQPDNINHLINDELINLDEINLFGENSNNSEKNEITIESFDDSDDDFDYESDNECFSSEIIKRFEESCYQDEYDSD